MISALYKKYLIFLLLVLAQNSANGMSGQKELQKKLGILKGSITELKGKLSALHGKLGMLQSKLDAPPPMPPRSKKGSTPPPPPPPPPMSKKQPSQAPQPGAHSADLLHDIQQGKQLKHVAQELETEMAEKVKKIVLLFESLDLENPNKATTEEILAKINEFKIDIIKKAISEIEKKDPKFINKLRDAASKININWENFDCIKSIIIPSSLQGVLQQALKAKFQPREDDEDESGDDAGWDDETPAYTPKVEKKQEQAAAAPAPKTEEKKKDEGKGKPAPMLPARPKKKDAQPAAKPIAGDKAKVEAEAAAAERLKKEREKVTAIAKEKEELLKKIDDLIGKIRDALKLKATKKIEKGDLANKIYDQFKGKGKDYILQDKDLLIQWLGSPDIEAAINQLADRDHKQTLTKFKASLEELKRKIQTFAPKEPSAVDTSVHVPPSGPGSKSEPTELERSFLARSARLEQKIEEKANTLRDWTLVVKPIPKIEANDLKEALKLLSPQDLKNLKQRVQTRKFSTSKKQDHEAEMFRIIEEFKK